MKIRRSGPGWFRVSWKLSVCLISQVLLVLATGRAAVAQELALKRALPPEVPLSCEAVLEGKPAPLRPTPAAAQEAERLRSSAQQASLLGEITRARELLQRATTLDPTAAQLAYHYARILEALGETRLGYEEYCRYLALAPESEEKEEIRAHTATLAPLQPAYPIEAMNAFSAGIQHYDDGSYQLAATAFSTAIAEAPGWTSAYFNRALARIAEGSTATAAADLERYLALAPMASDRELVERVQEELTTPPRIIMVRRFSPTTSLVGGLLIPGLGQFYTRRPAPGLLTLAAVGGVTLIALQPATTNSPSAPPASRDRPYLVAGLGAAAAVSVLSALEAAVYAAKEVRPVTSTEGRPIGNGVGGDEGEGESERIDPLHLGAGLYLAPPALRLTPTGLRADLGLEFRLR